MSRRLCRTVRPWRRAAANVAGILVLVGACAFAPGSAAAEQIKIGLIRIATGGPLFIAQEKGYFAAEGLDAELVYFDSAQPIAVATVSGDIDFGAAGLTAGFYSLAGQGALRIIAGSIREVPGFQFVGYLASNRAYEAGLRSPKDFAGRAVAVPQIGSANHYNVSLLAEKYGFDLKGIRLLPLQSLPNVATAIAGGQADAGPLNATLAIPLVQRGDAKLIGWVGDETPWQFGAVWTATKTTNDKRDIVQRFLRAHQKGARDYHDAWADANDKRKDGPTAPEVLALTAKYLGQPPEQVKLGIVYVDGDARLDVKDILHQIAWYKSQGMVKPDIDGDQIVDKRYVVPLSER